MNPTSALRCFFPSLARRFGLENIPGKLFVAGAAFACFLTPVRAQNLLNSGFESGSGTPSNWTFSGNNWESRSTTAGTRYEGSAGLKINDQGHLAGDVGFARSTPVPITPGKKYIASIKCKIEAGGTTTSLYLEYRNSAGSIISGQSYHQDLNTVGSWETITVVPEDPTTKSLLAAPAGAVSLTVMAYSPVAQEGISYWDNASVMEVENVSVPNYSFANLTSGFPTDWTIVTEPGYSSSYPSAGTVEHYLGAQSLRIADGGGTLKGAVDSAQIPVIPGRRYIATIKAFISSGTYAYLYLDYYNAAGTKMLSYLASVSGTGTWQSLTVIPEQDTTHAQIVAPYGAAYLRIRPYNAPSAGGNLYFDVAQVFVDSIDFATAGVTVANGDFENVDGSNFPLEWSKYGTSNYETGSTTTVLNGTYSVRINDASGSEVGGVESKRFPVIEGKSYTVKANYNIAGGSNPQFYLYVRYFDNETDLTPNSYTPDEYITADGFSLTGSGWQLKTQNFTPPFLAKYASILLYSSVASVGDAYFDTVTVAANANTVSNGSFEDWALSGYPHSWTGYQNSANIVTSASTARFSDIARSLKIVDTSASEAGGARSNHIASGITVGDAYTASAMYYLESGSLDLAIEFWNSSDTRLSETHSTVSTTGSWQPVEITATAPSGTSYATVLITSSTTGTCVAYADDVKFQSAVVNVASRRQLFIDDYIVKSLTGVTKKVNTKSIATPILSGDSGLGESPRLLCYGSFFNDGSQYRLYYTTNGETHYATSSDGTTWTKPTFGDGTNIIHDTSDTSAVPGIGLSVIKNPTTSGYKAFGKWYYEDDQKKIPPMWYKVLSSTSGTSFANPSGNSTPTKIANGWDVSTVAWDATNSRYVGAVKYYDNVRRAHRMTTSTDGATWTTAVRTESLADTVDSQGYLDADCYGMGWYPYEGVYIGFAWIFQIQSGLQDAPGSQIGNVTPELVFSRDLAEGWYRPSRAAMIEHSATWNAGVIYTASYAVPVGNEVWMFFSGSTDLHASGNSNATSQIAVAKWNLDEFVSLEETAGSSSALVLTKKIKFTGSSLKLNVAAAGGSAQVELLDSTGAVISGYSRANCTAITSDNLNATVSWTGGSNISALAGQTLQLKIYLTHAKLYALQFQ